MKLFIGMETSGQVRRRSKAMGHDVISCDLLPSIDGADRITIDAVHFGGGHIRGDVFLALRTLAELGWWPDAALFHPDCTYLTVAAEWAYKDPDFSRYPGVGYHQRLKPGTLFGADRRAARTAAVKDWERIDALPIRRKIAENPARGALSKAFRPPEQRLHPYMLGDDASKETGLWLWNTEGVEIPPESEWVAPTLRPTGKHYWANQTDTGQNRLSPGPDRWQERSKTFDGIADALATALVRPFAEKDSSMNTLSPTPTEGAPQAIVTNGEGQSCTTHLNLTVDMTGQVKAETAERARYATMTHAKRDQFLNKFSTKRAIERLGVGE